MNGFLEFHMARSNIEMQRKRNRDGVLNSYQKIKTKDRNGRKICMFRSCFYFIAIFTILR